MRLTLPLCLACLCTPEPAEQQLTVHELLERAETNPIVISQKREITEIPADQLFRELVEGSSLIVEGTLKPIGSDISPNNLYILTYHAVDARQILFNRYPSVRPLPGVERGIVLIVFGGSLTFQGVTVTAVDENIAYWKPGADIVLFLKPSATRVGAYDLAMDFIGVFGVTPDGIEPFVKPAELVPGIRGMSRDAFVGRVRQEIAKQVR
jgi:hypothetical protein